MSISMSTFGLSLVGFFSACLAFLLASCELASELGLLVCEED